MPGLLAWKAIGVALVAAVVARAGAQNCAPVQLSPANGTANDAFGSAAAASSDTIVFGAPGRTVGINLFQGQAFVYRFSGAAWNIEGTLTATDGATGDSFGSSAAISGDTILVGAPNKTIGLNTFQGACYVYTRTGAVWTQQARLTASDGVAGNLFGCAVSIFGDTAIIGAYANATGANFNQGAAYVFTRSGSVWTQQAKLLASDGAANDYFGFSVSAGLDTVVVGASSKTVSGRLAQGAAYAFTRAGTVWTQQAKLVAADGAAGDAFGASVSLSGESVLIGAKYKQVGANAFQGAGYVFVRSGSNWTEQAKLVASDGGAFDYYGSSCVLSGETAILGAPNQAIAGNAGQGSAYVYSRSGVVWAPQSRLLDSAGQPADAFGTSVAMAGSASIGGMPSRTVGANLAQGAALVFGSNIPINIIQQPATSTACTSAPLALSLTAAGTGPFGYQWQWKSGTSVPSWIPVSSGQNSAGSRAFTAANITGPSIALSLFSQATPGQPFAEFRCIVSNSCGSATSATAQVSVCWADLTCDLQIDDSDFVLFANAYNVLECADPSMPPRCPSDLNFDSMVDDADFAIFAAAYDVLVCP